MCASSVCWLERFFLSWANAPLLVCTEFWIYRLVCASWGLYRGLRNTHSDIHYTVTTYTRRRKHAMHARRYKLACEVRDSNRRTARNDWQPPSPHFFPAHACNFSNNKPFHLNWSRRIVYKHTQHTHARPCGYARSSMHVHIAKMPMFERPKTAHISACSDCARPVSRPAMWYS